MQSLKNKTKAELINIITGFELKKSKEVSPEKLAVLLGSGTSESKKLECLIKLTSELAKSTSFKEIGIILYENLKIFKKPGNWGVKLAVYNKSIDEYSIVFPDGQPSVCAPVLTKCRLEDVGYYSQKALTTHKTLLIQDNHSDDSLKIDSRQAAMPRGSMIFIPLLHNKENIGLFSYSASPENSLDDEFINFLEAIALLLSSSINSIFRKTNDSGSYPEGSRKDEIRYKRLLDAITDYHYHVIIQDSKPVKTIHNKSCLLITGYEPHEFDNDPYLWFKMIYEEDRDKVQLFIDSLFREKTTGSVEHRIVRKDGSLRWIKNTIIPELDKHNDLLSYDGLLADITNQKLYEEQIRASEEKLNKVFNQSPDLMIVVSLEKGKVIDINRSAIELLHIEKSDIIGKNISDTHFLTNKNFEEIKAEIKDKGTYRNDHHKFTFSTEETYDIDLIAESIEIADSECVLLIGEDRTKQRRMQSELERIHNLESIGILAGGIAHDFNNVLTAILGNISFVKMNLQSDDRMYKFLSRAEDSCFKAKELSNRLLTFSKGGRPKIESISIVKLVNDYAMLSLSGSNVYLNFQVKDTIDSIAVDQEQIRQVITSIVENAREAMPHGGELIVRLENESVTGKSSLPLNKGQYVKISFIDHGIGIPPENIAKIFDPYFSTKTRGADKGMGLGLSISYSIINKHNGCITVTSKPGYGSTFSIYLPSAPES